jgi:hypothetical protein
MHKVETTRFPRMRIVRPSRLQPFEVNSLISQVAGKGVARYNGWAAASAIGRYCCKSLFGVADENS